MAVSKRAKTTSKTRKVIFDAARDNGGKGLSPDEIIKILEKKAC